jgi:hypothetical protein
LELGEAFVPEVVPDMAQKVAASGFGVEEVPVLLLGELKAAVDIAPPESQV